MTALMNSKAAGALAMFIGLGAAIWLAASEMKNVHPAVVLLAIVAGGVGGYAAIWIRSDVLAEPKQQRYQSMIVLIGFIAITTALGLGPEVRVIVASAGVGFMAVIMAIAIAKFVRGRDSAVSRNQSGL